MDDTRIDQIDIGELYSRYCHYIDQQQGDEWVGTFTEDGVFESPRFGRFAGHDALIKFTKVYRESLGGARTLHLTHNRLTKIEGDSASSYCDFTYYHTKDAHIQAESVGFYTDLLKRTPVGWRFARRTVTILGSR